MTPEERCNCDYCLSNSDAAHARLIMTPEEKEEQRQSFAFGNVSMHNPDVTREMVTEQARKTLGDCQYRHDWVDGKCNTCGAVDSIKRVATLQQENERLKAEAQRNKDFFDNEQNQHTISIRAWQQDEAEVVRLKAEVERLTLDLNHSRNLTEVYKSLFEPEVDPRAEGTLYDEWKTE